MPLSKILLDIATETGISVANPAERAWIVDKVNDIALELYQRMDIDGSLREQTFNISQSDTDGPQYSSLVALPYYVNQIRGIRFSAWPGGKVPQNDMRPRYSVGKGWGDGSNEFSTPFRMVQDDAPLKRDIVNASVLTLSVNAAATAAISIYIVGKTTNAERAQETVVLPAGELEVQTAGNFEVIESISKVEQYDQDIYISDVDGNELAVLFNSQTKTCYKLLELQDNNAGYQSGVIRAGGFSAIDVLYKIKFTPFANLQDEFPCGPKCDRAIFYQFVAMYAAQNGQPDKAAGYGAKADELLGNINGDSEGGKNMSFQFGRDGFNTVQQPFRYGWGWNDSNRGGVNYWNTGY